MRHTQAPWRYYIVTAILILLGPSSQGMTRYDAITIFSKPLAYRVHSHNDYEQRSPLEDALSNGFNSVEADLWLEANDLLVSHDGFWFNGALEDLYLKPLKKIVDRQGSVHGDWRTFYLWLDLKQESIGLSSALYELLSRYPMLSIYTDNSFIERPVTVILTGSLVTKRDFIETYPLRFASRDSVEFKETDPPASFAWNWYSLNWKKYIGWNGKGTMPPEKRRKLCSITELIHFKGRRVRFWNVPETTLAWRETFDAGVDFVGVDDLQKMSRWIRDHEKQ